MPSSAMGKPALILLALVAVALLAARMASAGAQQGNLSATSVAPSTSPLSCLQNTTASLAVACPDIVQNFADGSFTLGCSQICSAAAAQLPRRCVNELVSAPLYGEAFQALFEICKRTYTDPGTITKVGELRGGVCLADNGNRQAAQAASKVCSSLQVSIFPAGQGFSPNCSPDCTDALAEISNDCINEIAADREVGFINRLLLRVCGTRSPNLPVEAPKPPAPKPASNANFSVFSCLNEAPNKAAGAQVQASCTDLLVATADGRFGIDCPLTCQDSLARVTQACIDQIATTSFYGQAFRFAFVYCLRGFTDGPGALVGRAVLQGNQCLQSNRNRRHAGEISTNCANMTVDYVPQVDGTTLLGLSCPLSCGKAISRVDSDCLEEVLQDEQYGALNEIVFKICNVDFRGVDGTAIAPGLQSGDASPAGSNAVVPEGPNALIAPVAAPTMDGASPQEEVPALAPEPAFGGVAAEMPDAEPTLQSAEHRERVSLMAGLTIILLAATFR